MTKPNGGYEREYHKIDTLPSPCRICEIEKTCTKECVLFKKYCSAVNDSESVRQYKARLEVKEGMAVFLTEGV